HGFSKAAITRLPTLPPWVLDLTWRACRRFGALYRPTLSSPSGLRADAFRATTLNRNAARAEPKHIPTLSGEARRRRLTGQPVGASGRQEQPDDRRDRRRRHPERVAAAAQQLPMAR